MTSLTTAVPAAADAPDSSGRAVTGAAPRPLAGLRVLDLSDTVAGQFCGKLFADQGASVRLLEPDAGSSTRRWTARGLEPIGTSALFRHLNADKACLVRDGTLEQATALLRRHAAAADVAIIDTAGAPPAWLAEENPELIVCHITPFGATGEYADWRGNELVFQALSGVMYQNGLPGREPLYGAAHRASCAAGAAAFIEATALLLQARPGGGLIDVSVAEVATSMNFNLITQFAYSGDIERRESRTVARTILRSSDGWVAIFVRDRQWIDTAHALGFEDFIEDPRYDTETHRLAHWDEFEAELEPRLMRSTSDEIVAAGQGAKAAVARAVTPLGLLRDSQLAVRHFWQGGPEPYSEAVPATRGAIRRLGPMFRMTPPDVVAATLPPELLSGDWKGGPSFWTERRERLQAETVPADTEGRPLAGLKVLEIATAWAGPMAARMLGALGADDVKVEGPARMDDWRQGTKGGPEGRYPGFEHGEHPYNRNCQFNTQNSDKRDLGLDLKQPDGQALIFELATVADVIVTNFRSGYLARIGITQERLRERNPRAVIIEMPAYGSGGPISNHVALGPSMEMMAGMASLVGYGDGKPITTGPAYLDPIGAFNADVAILAALANRELTGDGVHIELAQREGALHWIGEEIIEAIDRGSDRIPDGNRHAQAAPHRAFRTAGDDQWVAIAAWTDAEAAALGRVIGHDIAGDQRFATLADRKLHEDELDALVAAWAASRDKLEAAAQLQIAGVPAAAVMAADDLIASRFLRDRGMLPVIDQPEVGRYVHQGLPLHIEGVDLQVWRPTPRFGEHNREILRDWLDLSQESVDALYATETLADQPSAKGPTR